MIGIPVFDAEGMRQADREAIEDLGIPSLVLMENAGRGVVEGLQHVLDDALSQRYAIVCGRGNNGGDGLVVARHLLDRGVREVWPVLTAEPERLSEDAHWNYQQLLMRGITIPVIRDMDSWLSWWSSNYRPAVLVDALFGTGLTRPLQGFPAEWVEWANNQSDLIRVAIDIPSGLFAGDSQVHGPAFRADFTFTMAGTKRCLVFPPACEYAGAWYVVTIGTPPDVLKKHTRLYQASPMILKTWLKRRPLEAHKGQFGRILVIGGSPGRLGAAWMAGMAALRAGAGLVTVVVPESCWTSLMAMSRELMTLGLPDRDGYLGPIALDRLKPELEKADVVILGPGIGTAPSVEGFIDGLLDCWKGMLLVDADGLNILAQHPDWIERCPEDTVFTPHPGEMARLTGESVHYILEHRLDIARSFAETNEVILVLKGYRTLVAHPDGTVIVNPTGNPGMATAGMGDILSGVIGGFMGQLGDPWRSAILGVYLHGAAGDLARDKKTEESLIATDLLETLCEAVSFLEQANDPWRL